MIAGTPVNQYPEMAEFMHQTHYQFSKAPGSKAGPEHQQRPPAAGNGARPQAQPLKGPPGATRHHQAQRQQAQQQNPGQNIPHPQTAVPRAPASSAYTTSQPPFSQAGGGHAAPRVPSTRPVGSNALPPDAGRKAPSQAKPPPPSEDEDWPALPKAAPKQTSQGRRSTPAPRTSGFGGGPGSRSMVSQADSQEQLAPQATPHPPPRDFRTGQEVTELSRSPSLPEYAYSPERMGTRDPPTPIPMTRLDSQHNWPTPQLPRAGDPRVPPENARQADGGHTTDQLPFYRFRPDRSCDPRRVPQPRAEAATPQLPHDPEVSPMAVRPGFGAIRAPVDEARRVPPPGTQQAASTNISQTSKSSSDAATKNAPTAHRPRSHSAAAYHRFSPTIEASLSEESADREADFLDRARHAAAIKSEKLKDMEGQLKRLEADYEHLIKQHDLLEAKAIEDERRYLELRREADQHRHAAIVAVGAYQKARQEFSAKISASGAQCQAKIAELEKHLEAVRRDRDEALSTARAWIEQFKRDLGDDSTSEAELEIAIDADGQQATAPSPDSRESNENEAAKTQIHSLRRVLAESTGRTRRALEVARELTRLKEVLERRIDEGRKTQDRLIDELSKKDQMIHDITSTHTAMEAVAKQLQDKIEQHVKGSDAQIKETKSECEKLRVERDQAISAYQTEHAAEEKKQQAVENRLKELETELSKYSKLFEKYETDFDELEDGYEDGSDAEALGRAIDRRLKELGTASDKKIDEMQKKLQEAEGKLQMVQKTLEEKKAQLKELKKELREHKSALETAESEKSRQLDLLEERLKTVEHEKADMEEKLTDVRDELTDLTVCLEAEKNKPKSDEATMRALRNNLEMAEAKIAFLESEHPGALGSGFHEYSELVGLRFKLRGKEDDLQAKQREIEVLEKRLALGSEKSAKNETQALEIERLNSEIADKIRIIQRLEERNLTQGVGSLESGNVDGQTVLERWHSSNLTAVEAELVKITAKEIEGNWARKNAENKNRIKKLENSAKADEARIKKQEEEQKAMMARYETEIRTLKAHVDGQARQPLTENKRDSSSSLSLSPPAGNETNDKDGDTIERVLDPTVDLFAVPDSLPVAVASFVGAQPSTSPPTIKGKKRKVDALTGTGIGNGKSPLDSDKSKVVLVDSTPLEAPSESSANKRQIKKTRSNVEQEAEDGDWRPDERVSTSARNKKRTIKTTQSGVKWTGTRGQHQPSVEMPIATQNPAHLRRA